MSKSLYAIGGLGLGSCVVLSLMMQHLLEARHDKERPPVLAEIEDLLGMKLDKPPQIQFDRSDVRVRAVLELRVLAGLRKKRLAHTAGDMVWRRHAVEDPLDEVVVVVRDNDGGREEFEVPRPRMGALRPGGNLDIQTPRFKRPTDNSPEKKSTGQGVPVVPPDGRR